MNKLNHIIEDIFHKQEKLNLSFLLQMIKKERLLLNILLLHMQNFVQLKWVNKKIWVIYPLVHYLEFFVYLKHWF